MNRENKRKTFEKGHYKTYPCRDGFACKACGREVVPEGAGSRHRNHCPYCLTSLHLDVEPGDRAADCGGRVEAVAIWVRRNGEWAVIHRCTCCGVLSSNRIAADDNPLLLMSLALRPLAETPFPVARMQELVDALQRWQQSISFRGERNFNAKLPYRGFARIHGWY